MRIFLVLMILCATLPRPYLLGRVAIYAASLQQSCTSLFSESFRHRELAQGFLCGTNIQSPKDRFTFQQTGLIHLMVVSGSHLQILAFLLSLPTPQVLKRRRFFSFLTSIVLTAYALATGFQAPVVRALMARWISSVQRAYRWNWDLGKIQIASGVFCIFLFPEWIHSFSFFLSWLASMAFLLAPLCFAYRRRNSPASFGQILLTCALIQSFMMIAFGSFSALAVMMNAIFGLPLAVGILILSLAPALAPFSISICDSIWDWLLMVLEKTVWMAPTRSDFDFSSLRWMTLWTFLLSLQALLHWIHQRRYRASNV